jgi:hypothetical protein
MIKEHHTHLTDEDVEIELHTWNKKTLEEVLLRLKQDKEGK